MAAGTVLEIELSAAEVCILAGFVARIVSPDEVEGDELLVGLMKKCQAINFVIAEYKANRPQTPIAFPIRITVKD